jgi:putative restriction endonuclease
MQGWVAVTDYQWYERLLADGREHPEVNFWQPSARAPKRMPLGTPFFFKLKKPHRAICGMGTFVRFSVLPDWLAWDTFGRANGVASLHELRQRLGRIREGARITERSDIGCCLLAEVQLWPEESWIRQPSDWGLTTQVGATYDLEQGEGLRVWTEAQLRVAGGTRLRATPASLPNYAEEPAPRYGTPKLVRPRLGQGIFRVSVLEAYGRACAITGEHSLPVLDTAHIQPFAEGGGHEVDNGLPLRVDLHRLFDRGYVTFDEQRRLVVSRRLKEEFENGKTYYGMAGQGLRESTEEARPDRALAWHREHVFVG